VAFFISFALMGVWHGTTDIFLIYGVLLGGGVAMTWLYQRMMRARLGKKRYRALREKPLYILAGRGGTAAYLALAMTAFWVDEQRLSRLAEGLGLSGAGLALALLSLAVGLAFLLQDMAQARLGGLYARWLTWEESHWFGYLTLAVKLFVIMQMSLIKAIQTPEFVYEVF
jgi:hypothetical protein